MVPELTELAKAALIALLIRRNADPEGGTYMVQADTVFQPFEVLAPLASLDPD